MKFICSSAYLLKTIDKELSNTALYRVNIATRPKAVFIGGQEMGAETLGVGDMDVPVEQLRRLQSLLKLLSDQPLTIDCNPGNNWVTIQSVII